MRSFLFCVAIWFNGQITIGGNRAVVEKKILNEKKKFYWVAPGVQLNILNLKLSNFLKGTSASCFGLGGLQRWGIGRDGISS